MKDIMPIGVLVDGENPIASLRRVKSLAIPTCQMDAPLEEKWYSEAYIARIKNVLSETGVTITCLFCHFSGETYDDISTIKETVGLLNPVMREERIKRIINSSEFAKKLEISTLAVHLGFIPEDKRNPDHGALVLAVQRIAQHCEQNKQNFALETGQESPQVLHDFIMDVDRTNVGINFDPANMLLYDKEDPIKALDILGKYVIGVHCKDGKRPKKKGELGKELPLGEGDVGIKRFINKLKQIRYTGPLTIEREITGRQQTEDILKAKKLLENLI